MWKGNLSKIHLKYSGKTEQIRQLRFCSSPYDVFSLPNVVFMILEVCYFLRLDLDTHDSRTFDVLQFSIKRKMRFRNTWVYDCKMYLSLTESLCMSSCEINPIVEIAFWWVNEMGSEILLESCHVLVCFYPKALDSLWTSRNIFLIDFCCSLSFLY